MRRSNLRLMIPGIYADDGARLHFDIPQLLVARGIAPSAETTRRFAAWTLRELRHEVEHVVLIAHIHGVPAN